MCFKHERVKFQWKKWVQILHLFTIRVEGADPQKVLKILSFLTILLLLYIAKECLLSGQEQACYRIARWHNTQGKGC